MIQPTYNNIYISTEIRTKYNIMDSFKIMKRTTNATMYYCIMYCIIYFTNIHNYYAAFCFQYFQDK